MFFYKPTALFQRKRKKSTLTYKSSFPQIYNLFCECGKRALELHAEATTCLYEEKHEKHKVSKINIKIFTFTKNKK